MKRTITITALAVLILFAVQTPVPAQHDTVTRNNIYKIDDRLYEIYNRGEKIRAKKECMSVYDTLKLESIRLGDKKAECLAYVGQLSYILSIRDTTRISEYKERLMEVSRRNGYLQYFYYAISNTCTTYLNMGLMDKAKECIEEMKKYAQSDNYEYGFYVLYNQTAHFSMKQSDFEKAAEMYLKAAHLCETSIPDQIPVGAYNNAAIALMAEDHYQEALDCAKKALEYCNTPKNTLSVQNTICTLMFLKDDFAGFRKEYAKYQQLLDQAGNSLDPYASYAPALMATINGEYDKALQLMLRAGNSYLYFQTIRKVYMMMGDYKSALAITDSIMDKRTASFRKSIEYNVAENQTQLDNMRLANEKKRLELENSLARRRSILMLVSAILLITAIYVIAYVRKMHEHVKRLEKANAAKDVFVRNMSHEVRTPLNAVVGFSQMMAFPEMLTDEQRQQFSQYITGSGAMLAMLIDDVLDSLDLDSERFKVNIKDSHPDIMCRMAIESTREKVHGDVTMSYKSNVPAGFTFRTDPLRVQQMLQNLLNNACKNTESGSIVLELSHDESAGKVIFSVTDTGCGVPADKAEKIFERFVKLDDFKPGSGMGLAICREISEKLGGTIALDTTYTSGARFVLTLPVDRKS